MKELKGLLLCSGGYSSSILADKLTELGKPDNLSFDEGGLGMTNFEDLGKKYDVILLAPHLSMYYEEYEDIMDDLGKPFIQVEQSEYVVINAHKLYERIKESLKI